MSRGQRKNHEHGQRRCIVTGETTDKRFLARFVTDANGSVVPDIENRLPGRGMWIRLHRDLVERALSRNIFTRVARRRVRTAADLPEKAEICLINHLIHLLCRAYATKAAFRIQNFADQYDNIEYNYMLFSAMDGEMYQNGQRRFTRNFSCLNKKQLGKASEHDSTDNIVVKTGGITDHIRIQAYRLISYRKAYEQAPVEIYGSSFD